MRVLITGAAGFINFRTAAPPLLPPLGQGGSHSSPSPGSNTNSSNYGGPRSSPAQPPPHLLQQLGGGKGQHFTMANPLFSNSLVTPSPAEGRGGTLSPNMARGGSVREGEFAVTNPMNLSGRGSSKRKLTRKQSQGTLPSVDNPLASLANK